MNVLELEAQEAFLKFARMQRRSGHEQLKEQMRKVIEEQLEKKPGMSFVLEDFNEAQLNVVLQFVESFT